MRKIYLSLIVIIAGVGVFIILQFRRPATVDVRPEVLNISVSQATIVWLSEAAYKGRVFYKPTGSNVRPLEAVEAFGGSHKHEVIITGLKPSSSYTYWIGKSKNCFRFQTQPDSTSPFSFLIVAGNISERIVPLVASEVPEFIISATAIDKGPDSFSDIRPYIPVYGPSGIDSPFLRAIGEEEAGHAKSWKLDWGGLRLIFSYGADRITTMLDAPAAHTLGVITSMTEFDEEVIKQTELHSILVSHNEQNPDRPAAFVGVYGEGQEAVEIDGIQYFRIGAGDEKSRGDSISVRIDVDVESVGAVFLDDDRELALKRPPLKERRTCRECRLLADKGAYEESIKAYKDFIASHQGHFQISDAYFAVASIYDEKLFKFTEALEWYNSLLKEYPKSTLSPLAKQRIKYLSEYCDYNYEPLAQFDRIRKIEYARKKHNAEERNKLLTQVASVINKYPDSKLAPVMQYWLANQYRQSEPDKAVKIYHRLRDEYPNSSQAEEVLIEIGETYYDAGRYHEAIEAYTEALAQLPAHQETIKAQISRSMRNIRRDKIAVVCWGVIIAIMAAAILRKPIGVDTSKIVWSILGFIILEAILLFGAWLIREQFSSVGEMLLITIFFSAAAGIGSLISANLAEKFVAKTSIGSTILSVVTGSVTGVLFLAAGVYLTIYYVNVHYLIVAGM